jgi:exosome complex component RRP46
MNRLDFRQNNEIRALTSEIGLINEADGSGRFCQGNTCVLTSVYGPQQPRYQKHELYNEATLEIEYSISIESDISKRTSSNNSSMTSLASIERECACFLKQTLLKSINLTNYPRMLILLKVYVQKDDGSMLSCALNSCVLALINSGIPMLYVPYSISIYSPNNNNRSSSNSNSNDELILDPTSIEEESSLFRGTFVFSPAVNHSNSNNYQSIDNKIKTTETSCNIISSEVKGLCDVNKLFQAIEFAMISSSNIHKYITLVLKQYLDNK